jgi:hypothetical protein
MVSLQEPENTHRTPGMSQYSHEQDHLSRPWCEPPKSWRCRAGELCVGRTFLAPEINLPKFATSGPNERRRIWYLHSAQCGRVSVGCHAPLVQICSSRCKCAAGFDSLPSPKGPILFSGISVLDFFWASADDFHAVYNHDRLEREKDLSGAVLLQVRGRDRFHKKEVRNPDSTVSQSHR